MLYAGVKLKDVTGFDFLINNELGTMLGVKDEMHMWDCGFPDANLIWLLSACEVPCGIAIFRWHYRVSPSVLQMLAAQ